MVLSISGMSFLHENRAITQTIVEPPYKRSIWYYHCTFMAVLCIGAEKIKVLWGFSDKARWHFILFGVIFTVTQVGDHIVGRNVVQPLCKKSGKMQQPDSVFPDRVNRQAKPPCRKYLSEKTLKEKAPKENIF